jgi:hypothetical protein
VKHVAIGIAAILLFISTLGGAAYYLLSRDSGVDRQTLCPKEGPLGHTVLLVDKTDPLNFNQRQAFLRLLEELVDQRIARGHLISVFVLGDDFRAGARPLVEICNPGEGEGKTALTANIPRLQAQFRERFRAPLLEQADALVSTTPAKTSPILEMLQLVAINGFRKHPTSGNRQLIIVSDMLHKTTEYSMYQGIVPFDHFASTDYGRKTATELPKVEVEIHHVLHYPKLQTPQQLDFWSAYFARSGARIFAVRPLEG